MCDMRDLVPWALVYGAQNERHAKEIDDLNRRCSELEVTIKELSCMAVRRLLLCCVADFADRGSQPWNDWQRAKKNLTADDIREIEAQICREVPAGAPWFSTYVPELRLKAHALRGQLGPGGP